MLPRPLCAGFRDREYGGLADLLFNSGQKTRPALHGSSAAAASSSAIVLRWAPTARASLITRHQATRKGWS